MKLAGIGWPSISASLGLWSNSSSCDGPPAMESQITRLAFCGSGSGWITPRPPGAGAANPADEPSSEVSASAPMPWPARPRKARRLRWVRADGFKKWKGWKVGVGLERAVVLSGVPGGRRRAGTESKDL